MQKKGADGHGHDNGHEKNFDVFAPLRMGKRLEPLVGRLFQIGGAFGQRGLVRVGLQGRLGLPQGGVQRLEGLRGKHVALGVAQLAHMPAQVGRSPHRGG